MLKTSENSDRLQRLSWLKTTIKENKFHKQEQIADALKKAGFEVTQSNISRDLQLIGAGKISGIYHVFSDDLVPPLPRPPKVRSLVCAVDCAGPNLVVVKTQVGAAQVVAAAFDGTSIDGMIGTVAGDDTFFVATKNKAAQQRVIVALDSM